MNSGSKVAAGSLSDLSATCSLLKHQPYVPTQLLVLINSMPTEAE